MKNKLAVVLISFVLVINSFSGIFSAEEITEYDDQVVYAAENTEEVSDLIELPEKKERFTNHYIKPDGTYLAVMYTEPVNYYTNGSWDEIDNSLINVYNRDNTEVIRNESNDYVVEFAKSTSSGKLVNIKASSYELSWSISSGTKDIAAQTAEIVNSAKASSSIRYASALQDVDIKYTVSSTRVREDIVLNSPAAASEFQFDISCKNLIAKLEDDNSVSFIDLEKPGEVVFTMEAPYMYDSSESADISYDIEVLFTETEFGYLLVYKPDKTWLDSPERVYPIIIDPTATIYSTRTSSAIKDTYIHLGDAPGQHTLLTYLRVGGIKPVSEPKAKTLIKTDLPSISGTVYSAKLLLSTTSGSSTFENINVYRMNSSWTSANVSWADYASLSKTLIASNIAVSAYSNSPSSYRYVCDVTDTVQDFYKGTRTNNGFMVGYADETADDYNAFYSSDCGTTNVMPCLYISYVYGETSGITNGGIYYIKNKHSGKYLDVQGAWTDDGSNVIQYSYHGLANQLWKVEYYGNGLYRFQAMHTNGKYLEVASYSNTNGIGVDISSVSISRQLWSVLSNGDGSYRILTECSNLTKGLTVEGASTVSPAEVIQYTYTGTGSLPNDDWVFESRSVYGKKAHSGNLYFASSSDNFNGLCSFGSYGSLVANQCMVEFSNFLGGQGYNNVLFTNLFRRTDANASKNDFLSREIHSLNGPNVDDVELMLFCGHGTSSYGLHFTNGVFHGTNHFTSAINLPRSETDFGYGDVKTKWVTAYTCNFLNATDAECNQLMKGINVVLGYGSTSYLVTTQMADYAQRLKRGENIIDSWLACGTYHTIYLSTPGVLKAYYVNDARNDTLYNYLIDAGSYYNESILNYEVTYQR